MKRIDAVIIALVLLGMIVAGFVGWQSRQGEVDEYRQMLNVAGAEIVGFKAELQDIQSKLGSTDAELVAAKVDLESAWLKLDAMRKELKDTQLSRANYRDELEIVQAELMTAWFELEALQEELKDARKGLQWWPSVEALREWAAENELPIVIIVDSNGVIDLVNPRVDPRYDCDDYAEDLVKLAEKDGWRLMEVPVQNGMIWGIKVTDTLELHVGTWTKINNEYYYVESIPPHKVVRILPAD